MNQFVRRSSNCKNDAAMVQAVFKVLLRQSLEVNSVVCQQCTLFAYGKAELLAITLAKCIRFPRRTRRIAALSEQFRDKYVDILVQVEFNE